MCLCNNTDLKFLLIQWSSYHVRGTTGLPAPIPPRRFMDRKPDIPRERVDPSSHSMPGAWRPGTDPNSFRPGVPPGSTGSIPVSKLCFERRDPGIHPGSNSFPSLVGDEPPIDTCLPKISKSTSISRNNRLIAFDSGSRGCRQRSPLRRSSTSRWRTCRFVRRYFWRSCARL